MVTIPNITISMEQQLMHKFHNAHEYDLLCNAIAKTSGIRFVREVGSEKIVAFDSDGLRHEFLSYQEMLQALIVDKQNPSASARYEENVTKSSPTPTLSDQIHSAMGVPPNLIDARGKPFTVEDKHESE